MRVSLTLDIVIDHTFDMDSKIVDDRLRLRIITYLQN